MDFKFFQKFKYKTLSPKNGIKAWKIQLLAPFKLNLIRSIRAFF